MEWAALETTGLAVVLRGSAWAYPLVNAGHLLGVALLIGSVVPFDLRLLGLWRGMPLAPFMQVQTRTAAAGLGLAVICGSLLFITRASEYAGSTLFIVKMAAVAAGAVNALWLRRVLADPSVTGSTAPEKMPVRVRVGAGMSLAAWLAALVLGRLVGYY